MIRQWSSKCSGAHSQQNFGRLGRPGGCVPTGRIPHERSRTPTTSPWRSSVVAPSTVNVPSQLPNCTKRDMSTTTCGPSSMTV